MRVACLDSVAKLATSPTDSPAQRFLDDDDAGRHEFTVLLGRHGSHVLRYQRGALSVVTKENRNTAGGFPECRRWLKMSKSARLAVATSKPLVSRDRWVGRAHSILHWDRGVGGGRRRDTHVGAEIALA